MFVHQEFVGALAGVAEQVTLEDDLALLEVGVLLGRLFSAGLGDGTDLGTPWDNLGQEGILGGTAGGEFHGVGLDDCLMEEGLLVETVLVGGQFGASEESLLPTVMDIAVLIDLLPGIGDTQGLSVVLSNEGRVGERASRLDEGRGEGGGGEGVL